MRMRSFQGVRQWSRPSWTFGLVSVEEVVRGIPVDEQERSEWRQRVKEGDRVLVEIRSDIFPSRAEGYRTEVVASCTQNVIVLASGATFLRKSGSRYWVFGEGADLPEKLLPCTPQTQLLEERFYLVRSICEKARKLTESYWDEAPSDELSCINALLDTVLFAAKAQK